MKRMKKGLCLIVSANWRLENAQEPRRRAPGKQPTDATRMSIPRNTYLVSSCICDVNICLVSKLVTAELLSLG